MFKKQQIHNKIAQIDQNIFQKKGKNIWKSLKMKGLIKMQQINLDKEEIKQLMTR